MHDAPSPDPANPPPLEQGSALVIPQAPPGFLNDDSPAARMFSTAMVVIAAVALLANCLLTSPSAFSEAHKNDATILKRVVDTLGLSGNYPTARGIEVRNLAFYLGAACIALVAGLRMILAARTPRLTIDDLLDLKARAASPYFWWLLLLIVSFFSSTYSHAPDMCRGQMYARFLQTAWLWPLAAMLRIRHARTLSAALLGALALTAALALAYYAIRMTPGQRLAYPLGNELWLGACLLPGLFLAIGFYLSRDNTHPERLKPQASSLLCLFILAAALYLTRARSAQLGAIAGFIALAVFLTGRLTRRLLLLGTILAALGGSALLHRALQADAPGQRTASIRSRVLYEWPYALTLFFQKPIAGNGDGAYSMLAGQLAREDQLDDPGILRFDGWSWTGHAHNEFLELLCDLGLVGAIAYLVAIIITLVRTVQFCDRTMSAADRYLAAALGAALVAGVVDQCTNPAIREPGLPPIFLTVWAALWAMARTIVRPPRVAEPDQSLGSGAVKLGGAFVLASALALGLRGVQDWRAALARYTAARNVDGQRAASAITPADFAADWFLDPFQRAQARMIAASARNMDFDDALRASDGPPTKQQMAMAEDALVRIVSLERDVPRFLQVSRIATELYLNRARAFERMAKQSTDPAAKASLEKSEQDAQVGMLSALMQSQKDDPFLIGRVQALWKVHAGATALDRINWLRCLLRGGEFGDDFVTLFRQLPAMNDLTQALNDLYTLATQDADLPPEKWRDKLSPETLRAAALAKALSGKPAEAVAIIDKAISMYRAAGSRLAAAHSAALHEGARYRLAADPLADAALCLEQLAQADRVNGGSADTNIPLVAPLGDTRLLVLIAIGNEPGIAVQLSRLNISADRAPERLSNANADVALRCLATTTRMADAIRFARRAVELLPKNPRALAALVHAAIANNDDAAALRAATDLIAATPADTSTAILRNLRTRYPANPLWTALGDKSPTTQPNP
ncbi:MAG: O-antigen ligase family protein [Planctomycetes bacterium]|nr:O-antigen ligase family protein [Planctomycetota bacterium]